MKNIRIESDDNSGVNSSVEIQVAGATMLLSQDESCIGLTPMMAAQLLLILNDFVKVYSK